MKKIALNRNQSGLGLISLLLTVAIMALIGWFLLGGGSTNTAEKTENVQDAVEDVTNTVDKANQARDAVEQSVIPSDLE